MTEHLDPELAAAIQMARRLSRRRFLAQAGLGAGALALGPSLLAACGGSSDSSSDGSSSGGMGDKELRISNWTAYIDQDDDGNFDAPAPPSPSSRSRAG